LVRVLRYVLATMGLEVELYVSAGYAEDARVILTRPVSVAVKEEVFRGLFNKEQRFVLGRILERARPEYVLAAAFGAFDLMTLFEALWERGSDERGQPRPDA